MATSGAAAATGCVSPPPPTPTPMPPTSPHLNAEQSPQPEVAEEAEEELIRDEEEGEEEESQQVVRATSPSEPPLLLNKKLLLCRRFKDSGGILRNFNSLPLFVYATSPSTRATSADGVGVSKEAAAAAAAAVVAVGKNDSYDVVGIMDCLPLGGGGGSSSGSNGTHHHLHAMAQSAANSAAGTAGAAAATPTSPGVVSYQHHLNLVNHHHPLNHHSHHHHLLGGGVGVGHHSPYSNNYPLHHSNSHHHIHSEQTKSLQELQHEVGALLEFRDLVIETFPDLKHKMASMSSSTTSSAATVGASGGNGGGSGGGSSVHASSVSGTNTLTGSSLASRREWEPGIRIKRKISQKEPSTSTSSTAAGGAGSSAGGSGAVAEQLSSTSLTRSRSNSHSGKKEPKSGENNNGSVVQDSGFSTETSSSKEGHSASSTNGAMTATIAANRLACPESDDELLNLLDVIHRKSNRLREEVEHLQNYERQNLRGGEAVAMEASTAADSGGATAAAAAALTKSGSGSHNSATATATASSGSGSSTHSVLTPKTFREHVERLNKEDIKQLRRERDRLLDKLAEMEAETLTGRIKATKMSDQVEQLISVKRDLEEQLKLAMAQKLELSARVQQLQQQQQQLQSKNNSSSQSDYSSQRNFLSSATTVLSTGSGASQAAEVTSSSNLAPAPVAARRPNTFQPVVIEQHQQPQPPPPPQQEDIHIAFHQSAGSDSSKPPPQQQQQRLGRLDGIVSTPSARNAKCRVADSKCFIAILLETSVIELQRHLLTLTVQNQGLMQKLEQATKSKTHLAKRLDKSKEDVEDLRFQLEEKNIELEGTKAQLRVLESRFHSSTLSSGAATNSYLHSSQHDYETNRSSASTTLMLSRRGGGGGIDSHCSSDLRSRTPQSHATNASSASQHMPQPMATQISTPSMKAMTHLPMDELQHHSSSTESAHEHELQQQQQQHRPQTTNTTGGAAGILGRLMSTSVGGVSPFGEQLSPRNGNGNSNSSGQQQAMKKFALLGSGGGAVSTAAALATASKPSKIPLPGSKAAAYFAGKPPTGRPYTAGRSPPSALNTSHGSTTSGGSSSSNKSSLSRSTGNLLYSKSPNSLKRADSAQSIRKDAVQCTSNSSTFSNNSGRSSNTSSSIPMATTPYGGGVGSSSSSAAKSQTTPSARVLQNSPLPKLKRESLTSRVRHLDSLSRVHHAESPAVPVTSSTSSGGGGSYIVSSTPKPSSIAAQLNSTLRKDLQLSGNGSQQQYQYQRRTASPASAASTLTSSSTTTATMTATTTRRLSSAALSGGGLRAASNAGASPRHSQEQSNNNNNGVGESSSNGGVGGGGAASDSDSGKKNMVYFYEKPKFEQANCLQAIPATFVTTSDRKPLINSYKQNGGGDGLSPVMNTITQQSASYGYSNPYFSHYHHISSHDKALGNYLLERLEEEVELQYEEQADEMEKAENEEEERYFTDCSFASDAELLRGRAADSGDNLLVTFDYGFCDDSIPDSWRAVDDDDDDAAADKVDVEGISARGRAFAVGAEYRQPSMNGQSAACFANDVADNDDDVTADNEAHDAQIWFYSPSVKSGSDALPDADVAAAFQVHRMQHHNIPSQYDGSSALSLVSSSVYTEYNVDATDTEVESSSAEDDKQDIAEEQFYDSIECA